MWQKLAKSRIQATALEADKPALHFQINTLHFFIIHDPWPPMRLMLGLSKMRDLLPQTAQYTVTAK